MDVLHVIHQFAPETRGGSESYLLDVARLQRARGRDVQVLTGSLQWKEHIEVEELVVDGIPVHRLHRDDSHFDYHAKGWHPDVERRFLEMLQRWRPAVVHVHQWLRLTNNLVEIAHRAGVPTVVTLHDYWTSCPRAFRRRADDAACRRELSVASCGDCVPRLGHEPADEIATGIELFRDTFRAEIAFAGEVLVAMSSTADLLAATTGVPRSRYTVMPFGYQPRFAGMPRLPAPRAGEPLRFAFWGGVGRHKGVDVLVAAFARLCAAGHAAELHVLGAIETPAFEQQLRALAKGLPVTFHGAFTPAQLRAVAPHCGVFPSTCIETYGIVLDECFELGLPCIVSDLGALPLRSGAAGLVTAAGDAASLAAAMQRLCREPALWPQLAAATPPLPPSVAAHCDALQSVYERVRLRDGAPFAPPVEALRRVLFLQRQRETALWKALGSRLPE